MNPLKFIDQIKEMYNDQDPRSTILGPRNMAEGGRIAFDGGGSPLQRLRQEIVDSMRPYAPGDVTEDQLQLVVKDITLDMTAEQAQASAKANFIKLFGMAEGGRAGYNDGQLVTPSIDGSRPGYQGPERTNPYLKDKDFLKFAKEEYGWTPDKPTKNLGKVVLKYERLLAKKGKVFGIDGLIEILGNNNPYTADTFNKAFGSAADMTIKKNMSAPQKTRIKMAQKIRKILVDNIGEPKKMKEVYAPFKYLSQEYKKVPGSTTKVWEINKKQIKALNKELNRVYQVQGMQTDTIDNIYNLFNDKKFLNAVKKYDGKAVDIDSYLFKKVFEPGKGGKNAYAYMQLGRALQGKIELEGIKVNKTLGDKIVKSIAHKSSINIDGEMGKAAQRYAKLEMGKWFDNSNATYKNISESITKAFRDAGVKDLNIDEIFPARTGQLTYGKGSGVHNNFVQFIDSKINQKAKRSFDGRMSKRLQNLDSAYRLAKGSGDYSKVEKILAQHEKSIKNFYIKNPEAKGKVNLTKFHWDAKNKKFLKPEQVFESQYKGSYKTIPEKIRKGMEKFHAKTGISIDPGTARTLEKSGADVKTLTQSKAWNTAIKSSKAKMLAKTLELAGIKVCSSQLAKAGGGRIGFAEPVCGMKFAEQNEDAFMRKVGQSKKAADMFKSGNIAKHLMKAKNWAKTNMGPAGWIGGELLVVGLGTAWDMSQGKGWKEAMDNWTGLGGHFGQAEQRLRDIGTEHGWNEGQINDAMKIGQLMDLSTKTEEKQWELDQLLEAQDIGGTARVKYDPKHPGAYKPIQGKYQDPKKLRELKAEVPKMWEKGDEIYESLKNFDTSIELYNELQQRKALEEYNRKMKLRHSESDPFSYVIEEKQPFQNLEYQKHPLESPTQLWAPYAGGGMVGIRKPHAIAPTGGPQSQGLASTPEYGTYNKEYKWQK